MKTTKLLLGLLTITAALAMQVRAQSFLTNGLVAYYPFNGNANDASGNGSNATPFNISYVQDRFGVAGAAAFFNGSNSVIYETNFFSSQPTQITYSIWFATAVQTSWSNMTSVADQWNLATARSGPGGDYIIATFYPITIANGGNGPIYGNVAPGFGMYKFESYAHYYYCDITNYVFLSNQWHHVVGVYDGTAMTLYFDGTLQDTLQYSSGGQQVLDNLMLGNGTGPTPPLAMDDVRIYNIALSSNEVQQLYAYESQPVVSLKKAVKPSFANLFLGTNYQLQVSTDLNTWTNSGLGFTPTNSVMDYPQYFDVDEWSQLFFRLQVAP